MTDKLIGYFGVLLILFGGTILAYGIVETEAEAKAGQFSYTETSEVKKWQQEIAPERALQLDNQEDIDWTTLDVTEPNLIWATTDIDWGIDIGKFYDIVFCLGSVEVKFKMTDGKFDVIYDANDCTAAANTFFVCMKPHLQGMILEKAKELAVAQ